MPLLRDVFWGINEKMLYRVFFFWIMGVQEKRGDILLHRFWMFPFNIETSHLFEKMLKRLLFLKGFWENFRKELLVNKSNILLLVAFQTIP